MSSSAKLVFGLSVDPFKLLYHARAWSNNHIQLAYIDGLIDGRLVQDSSLPYTLPHEVLSMIKDHYWKKCLSESTCRSWALFGNPSFGRHPPTCCPNARLALEQMLIERDEGCDGECEYGGGSDGSDISDDFYHNDAACAAARLERDKAMMMEEIDYAYSEGDLYEDRWQAEMEFLDCFGKSPCSKLCQACQCLHPYLQRHGLLVVDKGTNIHAMQYSQPKWTCILGMKQKSQQFRARHDLEGGSQTSVVAVDSDDLASMIAEGDALEKLAKSLELPVVEHHFLAEEADEEVNPATKDARKAKPTKVKISMAELMKPRFYLVANSWCDY